MAGSRTIVIEGLDKILAKTKPELYEPSAKAMLGEIAAAGARSARAGAPRLKGKLRGSISPKTNGGPKPLWAVVKVGAVNPRGYSYPRLLEFSRKHGHANWLKSAVERAQGAFTSAATKAARAVERKWTG